MYPYFKLFKLKTITFQQKGSGISVAVCCMITPDFIKLSYEALIRALKIQDLLLCDCARVQTFICKTNAAREVFSNKLVSKY